MGIFDKFKKGFQKSASAFSSGLREIIIKKEINDSAKDQGFDAGLTNDIKKEIKEAKEGLDKITGPIKRDL